jgi:NMD protein affecting ribosome stability and mRNA decay
VKRHLWQQHEAMEDWVICLNCGLEMAYPEDWAPEDWEREGLSEDCDEQKVRQVMEA